MTQNHTLDVVHDSGKTGVCLHVMLVLCIRAKCLQIDTSADEYSSVIMLCQMEVFGEMLLHPRRRRPSAVQLLSGLFVSDRCCQSDSHQEVWCSADCSAETANRVLVQGASQNLTYLTLGQDLEVVRA